MFEQWAENQQVVRIKGFVLLRDEPQTRFLFQFVEGVWQLEDLGGWPDKAKTQLVILGLKEAQVMACLLPTNVPNNTHLREGAHGY